MERWAVAGEGNAAGDSERATAGRPRPEQPLSKLRRPGAAKDRPPILRSSRLVILSSFIAAACRLTTDY